jgi:integrase
MTLTATAVQKAKPTAKIQRLFDAGGLYLEIAPSGGKWWRLKYRHAGKEKRLSLGVYPETSLANAREKRDEARKLLATGVDPSENRKATRAATVERAANSFEAVAREWHASKSASWDADHAGRLLDRMEKDLFPWIGSRPIAEVSPAELLATLKRIVDRGAVETAHRALQYSGKVFRFAIASRRADRNPAADLREALPSFKETHRAAITDPQAIGALLRAIDGYEGSFVVRCALKLAPLTFVRPGELRNAEWAEFDLDKAEWNIPAAKMKMRQAHQVPLASQAVAVLRELHALTGHRRYVFPSPRGGDRPMSNNGVLSALRRMGFAKDEMSGHGFRAMARTVLDEVLNFRTDYIEHQLAHAVRDPNGRAYNRTAHLPERRKMMQAWSDYLDTLKNGGNVVPLGRKSGAGR